MHLKEKSKVENRQDQAVFDIIDTLMEKGVVDNVQDFCERVGMFKQSITEIYKGIRHFNVKQIREICQVFNVNANYIFGFSENKFRPKNKRT